MDTNEFTKSYSSLFEIAKPKNIIKNDFKINNNDYFLSNNYCYLCKQLIKYKNKANKKNPIDGMFYLLRKLNKTLKVKKKIKNNLDLAYFKNTIEIPFYEILGDISRKIRTMYYVNSIHVSYHNTSILLGNPELISIALFIMPYEEFLLIYNNDKKYTSLKGSDQRSIFDMTYTCLKNGLERSNSDYFIDYTYFTTSITLNKITSLIYDPIEMYTNSTEKDLSIHTLNNTIELLNYTPETVVIINNKYKQSEILNIFKLISESYILDSDIYNVARTFIQKLTRYHGSPPKGYIDENKNSFYDRYETLKNTFISDFISIIKHLSDKNAFTSKVNGTQMSIIFKELGCISPSEKTIRTLYKTAELSSKAKEGINYELAKKEN
ncbi:hypothetical protein [Wenyingzhuangia aestuarii]|uniref:hypothetical protein n=1 Tax=Wenyingzhuangia aestuarii TaxID=1647582 RepID=UPI00143C04F8|nr:hypothetical protein [Wenyingzhuangia aestuarii]NJB83123.1 hypothetical protein [Wenyingzhuangia aestuarii]